MKSQKMFVRVHPIVDQLTPWMDGQVCKKKKAHLDISIDIRLYFALRTSRYWVSIKRKKDLEAGTEFWEPVEGMLSSQDAVRIGKMRHILLLDRDWARCDAKLFKYGDSLVSKLSDQLIEKSYADVRALFHPICEGDFQIGWDEEGRMELETSAQGAQGLGGEMGERFFSFTGLVETGRAYNWDDS